MKIFDLRTETRGSWTGRVASLTWEDSDRPDRDLCFLTKGELSADLSRSGNPFLAGAFPAALKHGEDRIFVDGPCCPWLCDGLETVIKYFDHWFYGNDRSLRIETSGHAAPEREQRRTGAFVSGGLDSSFALWDNARRFPSGHGGRIRDAIVLKGFEIQVDGEASLPVFDRALDALAPVAAELDLELIPLITNLRQLEPDGDFWGEQFQGPILAAAAHALAPRLTDVIVAASTDVANLRPYGTHPALDPKLGSHSLAIHHLGERYTRLEKIKAMADWPTALDRLRVCARAPAGRLNCGRCEKCVRVMLELLVVGKLDGCPAFEHRDVTPHMLDGLLIDGDVMMFFADLVPDLRAIGRSDLARAIMGHAIRDMPRRFQEYSETILKDLDHTFNQGRLRTWVRRLREPRDSS